MGLDQNADGKVSLAEAFSYIRHPHAERHADMAPVKVADQLPQNSAFERFNSWLGLKITLLVGTMVCAYAFAFLALVSLPASLKTGNPVVIVGWVAQTFLQLILLPIIIVGQNIQAKAADARAEQTFQDAEAILHECLQLQEHLAAQDFVLSDLISSLKGEAKA